MLVPIGPGATSYNRTSGPEPSPNKIFGRIIECVRQYACRLNVNALTSFHLGNELNADTLISHLIETEEFPFLPQDPQIVLAPWHNNCTSG
ncbi:MAG: hypothetical protein JXA73_23775 [Acidobacteria bacterium]|nr:hypothetical protein [Acidobacteriota bacterium]